MAYWRFPRHVSVAEKKLKAAMKLKELSKKNPNLKPVMLQGSKIAATWWGKAWNLNLERYADYENRIGRGRSYVRHGAVLDLQIEPGEARALVQGSRSKPYRVVISIKTLRKEIWKSIVEKSRGMLESLQELVSGSFPKSIGEIFTHKDSGLFPSPKEITFSCSCPDWAGMCKHVAATLYGIGARLDESPDLFFRLRNVKMDDLVRQAVTDHKEQLLARASRKSSRIMDDADLSATFGIELQESVPVPSVPSRGKARAPKTARAVAGPSRKSAKPAEGPSRTKVAKESRGAVVKDTAPPKKRAAKTAVKTAGTGTKGKRHKTAAKTERKRGAKRQTGRSGPE